jgi:hypothetical protein
LPSGSVGTKAIRIVCATWLVVVFLGLILGVPYVIGRPSDTSPLDDPIVQMLSLLVATSVPAAFGLAYATHRRRAEETEQWIEGLR